MFPVEGFSVAGSFEVEVEGPGDCLVALVVGGSSEARSKPSVEVEALFIGEVGRFISIVPRFSGGKYDRFSLAYLFSFLRKVFLPSLGDFEMLRFLGLGTVVVLVETEAAGRALLFTISRLRGVAETEGLGMFRPA